MPDEIKFKIAAAARGQAGRTGVASTGAILAATASGEKLEG